ncbi:MAG: DUF4340 domain-containing protein [Gammaproteobacteria bacterium]
MKLTRGTLLNGGILLLACASLVTVLLTQNLASTKDSEGRAQNLLSVFRSDDATRVELRRADQTIAFVRAGNDGGSALFSLVEPVHELADATTVDKFLSTLESAHTLRPVERGPALSAFGLDKPTLRIAVQTPKSTYRVALGGAAPTPPGAHYVQIESGDGAASLFVVSKAVADDLNVELDAFRLRSLVSVNEADVTRVSVKSPTLSIVLRRSTGTSFLVEGQQKPEPLADRETVKSLFFQLGRLSATQFLSATEGEAALGAERAHFVLETKDSRTPLAFDAGGSCPGDPTQLVIMRRSPDAQSGCAPRELEATLRLRAADFSDRHPFSLHTDEIEELEIASGQRKFALRRKGTGFVLHDGAETQVELEAGNQRIAALLEAQAERVEGQRPSELGLDPAASTVTLRSSAARDSDVVKQVVRVGNKTPSGELFVYREQDGATLRLPREQARAFALDSTLLYARKLTEFGASSFVMAEIDQGGKKQLLSRGANQALRLELPKGFEPDGVLSSDFVQALGALTAERFVADRDDGTFGFEHSPLTVRFAFKKDDGAQVQRVLRFGSETTLGVFATLDDGGPVFILPRAAQETCSALLINRANFTSNSDSLSGLTLEARGRSLRIERQGERFVAVPSSALPADRVSELLDALLDLRPEAGIHTGPAEAAEGFAKPTLTLRLTPRGGAAQTVTIGAGDAWHSMSVFYLRVSGVEATFVIAQSKVRALSDAL